MKNETRIEEIGPIELMGVAVYGNPEITSFHKAWEYFGAVADEASISRINKDIYGLQLYHPAFPKTFEMTYMACMMREEDFTVPIRMMSKVIPRSKYVVQGVIGGVDGIDEVLMYLYQKFIPENGFSIAYPYDIEKYCNVLDHSSVPEKIEIWVPVK